MRPGGRADLQGANWRSGPWCLAAPSDSAVYGEIVALLWEKGYVPGAIELEHGWNELARKVPFSLMCGYPTTCLAEPEHSDAVGQLHRLHTAVIHNS